MPNPSFEEYSECPPGYTQIEFANGWVNPNGYSPDYFNSCVPDTGCCNIYSVPNNSFGSQEAKTGVAYGGIFIPITTGNNLREYVQIQLATPLIASTKYLVKFYVSLSESSNYSVNSIGGHLSSNQLNSSSLSVFNVNPQIVNNSILLVDKSLWYEISDTITAFGGEKFLTIGNFENDAVVSTTPVSGGSTNGECYYYIDEVSIVPFELSLSENLSVNVFQIYPNPAKDFLKFKSVYSDLFQVNIIDHLGRSILKTLTITNNDGINTKEIPNGIYFIQILSQNKLLHIERIIINH